MRNELKRSLCSTIVDVMHISETQRDPEKTIVRCVGWRCYYSSACQWVWGRQCIFEVWLIYVGYVRGLSIAYFSAWQVNWRFAALGENSLGLKWNLCTHIHNTRQTYCIHNTAHNISFKLWLLYIYTSLMGGIIRGKFTVIILYSGICMCAFHFTNRLFKAHGWEFGLIRVNRFRNTVLSKIFYGRLKRPIHAHSKC